ncbi:hypothetical protein ACFCW0_28350, partial [Streptomyces diastaticus]
MGWQTDQFGSGHEGYPVAVMGDGTEPAPINGNSAWWLYNGHGGRRLRPGHPRPRPRPALPDRRLR